MKNKWNSAQVRSAQRWLAETWPALFMQGRDLKPLSLKIHKEILQQPNRPADVSRRALMEALKRHTTSFGYLYGIIKATHRYHLNGEQAELISPAHQQWAKQTLRKVQKISQATSKRGARNRAIAAASTPQPRLRAAAPKRKPNTQITYKRSRRRLVARPAANAPVAA